MAASKMEKDTIRKAVGFEMNNLKSIPFSRLSMDIQVEVVEEMDIYEKVELSNVTSGFRGYFAKNGIFGGHVDEIKISLVQKKRKAGKGNDLHLGILIRKDGSYRHFDFLKERALFRHIFLCTNFTLPTIYFEEWESQSKEGRCTIANAEVKRIAEGFPSLHSVKRLGVFGPRHSLKEELLESFHFKVTDFAEFSLRLVDCSNCCEDWSLTGSLLESRHWEHLLANQLSICENVFFKNEYWDYGVPQDIPGMETENDPTKRNEIFEAVCRKGLTPRSQWSYYSLGMNCFRRKIDEHKEMMMLVHVRKLPWSPT